MALTENTFTGEELGAAITANPAIVNVIKTTLGASKYVVHDENEHTTYLKNYEDNVVSKKTGEFATNIEKDVKELTGIDKVPGEKYYDYLKRAVPEKLKSVTTLETELKALKEKGGADAADKARILVLEKAISDKETDYTTKLSEKDKQINGMRIGNELEKTLGALRSKYKANIPAEVATLAEQTIMAEVMRRAIFKSDNTIELMGDDGKTALLDPATMKILTIEKFVGDKLATLIDTGKKQEGAGSNGNGGNDGTGGSKFTGLPADVTSKVKLTAYLNKLGITSDSAEFSKLFKEHGEKMPLRD